jgi:hypothetical protein
MDKLDSNLNPRSKKQYHPSIRAAMGLAKKKLNRYYEYTDLSLAYRIAMGMSPCALLPMLLTFLVSVLHPGLKLEYFRQHLWESEWIDEVERLTREEYMSKYMSEEPDSGECSINAVATHVRKPVFLVFQFNSQ